MQHFWRQLKLWMFHRFIYIGQPQKKKFILFWLKKENPGVNGTRGVFLGYYKGSEAEKSGGHKSCSRALPPITTLEITIASSCTRDPFLLCPKKLDPSVTRCHRKVSISCFFFISSFILFIFSHVISCWIGGRQRTPLSAGISSFRLAMVLTFFIIICLDFFYSSSLTNKDIGWRTFFSWMLWTSSSSGTSLFLSLHSLLLVLIRSVFWRSKV